MSKVTNYVAVIGPLVFSLGLLATSPPVALAQASGPFVIHETKHDSSPPIRDIVPPGKYQAPAQVIPPHHPRLTGTPAEAVALGQTDSVLQDSLIALAPASNLVNFFNGVAADGAAPPDPNGSAGDTQFVEIVSNNYAVYEKSTGALLHGPAPINSIWTGFGGLCESTNGGDPAVLYDKMAHRWLVSRLAYSSNFSSNYYCVAISTTSDATGSYYRYAFSLGGNLPDYRKLGVWPDAYYWSSNIYAKGAATFAGAQACAFNRTNMLAGSASTAICFQESTSVANLLPSDLDGSTLPPSGEPNFFLEIYNTSALGLFKFHADFATPSNSTFTGPVTIPVASFTEACGGLACIPQPGTTHQLDSLGDRLMYRLAYRNFGDHESLVANHSVTAGTSVGVRWYEIRSPGGTPTVFQQGTYAPDLTSRWMGSIAMDHAGDIAVGYSASDISTYPAIRYTGRVPTDPLGTLESESSLMIGMGSQIGLQRWGGYTTMSVDPVDDCTFWYTNGYLMADGAFNRNTAIGSFRFPSCGIAVNSTAFNGSAQVTGNSNLTNPPTISGSSMLVQNTDGRSGKGTKVYSITGSSAVISATFNGSAQVTANSNLTNAATISGSSMLVQNIDGRSGKGTKVYLVTGK